MSGKCNTFLPIRLKKLRREKNLKQIDIARAIGVTKGAISAYENGWRQPSDSILIKLAKEYSVSVDYLLGNTDNQSLLYCRFTKEQLQTAREVFEELLRYLE